MFRSVSLNQLATNHYEEGDESEENDDDVMINRHVSKILMRNKFLTHLNLRHLRGVRDSGLQCVSRSLTHVDLGGCLQVSDSGVRRLASCPRLSSLSLSRTLITDRSLCSLSSGKCRNSLGELRVNGCVNITDSGIEVSHRHTGVINSIIKPTLQTLLTAGLSLHILIFHGCPGVTEQSRQGLETFLRNVGHRMRQVTWTVY